MKTSDDFDAALAAGSRDRGNDRRDKVGAEGNSAVSPQAGFGNGLRHRRALLQSVTMRQWPLLPWSAEVAWSYAKQGHASIVPLRPGRPMIARASYAERHGPSRGG